MKSLIFGLCIIFSALAVWGSPLLGAKECTWGPTYWCKNITTAKSCHAVTHCIQTVWVHQQPKHDNDSVCDICLNMVAQARDQLESNETQEQLKEVFEGSCKLIPIKILRKRCIKLVDEFVPELVETLSSQMNPEVVCSVAGLCNNDYVDKILAEHTPENKFVSLESDIEVNKREQECRGCYTVTTIMEKNIKGMGRDQMLAKMLEQCRRMGSFSDACSSIVITYFNEIYTRLQNEFSADSVCHISGVCSQRYHKHEIPAAVEIIPHGSVGVRPIVKDDLPCDLCAQLVGHLRDLLVANTTELEFQRILESICKQTNSFKKECLSIVDEYYPMIYQFLVKELDGKEVCSIAGLCPRPEVLGKAPIMPLLPVEVANKAQRIFPKDRLVGTDEAASYQAPRMEISYGDVLVHPEEIQLPVERLIPQTIVKSELETLELPIDNVNSENSLGLDSKEACSICEYVLHYLQVEISSDTNEDKIKHAVEHVCEKLPKSVIQECTGFVETYGPALIALFVQEIDPSVICPRLKLCAKPEVKDVEVLIHDSYSDKPSCPLCLFAVQQLEDVVKNDKTEERIRHALDTLCSHLPKNLAEQCDDFVETYSKELVELLISDLNPQEVCVYLKLCDAHDSGTERGVSILDDIEDGYDGEVLTNEIPDDTVNGLPKVSSPLRKPGKEGPQCVLCEFVMTKLEQELKDKKNEDEIKNAVHNICRKLPHTISTQCDNFVNQYADMIIKLLIATFEPNQICAMMDLCNGKLEDMKGEVIDCAICHTVVETLDRLIKNPKVDHEIEHLLRKACIALPAQQINKCKQLVKVYGPSMINLIEKSVKTHKVCSMIGVCGKGNIGIDSSKVELIGAHKCSWGPSYWCSNSKTANECNALKHCQEKVWLSETQN